MQLLYNRIESQWVLLSFAAVAPTNQPMFSGKINQDRVIYLTSPKAANEFHIRACFNKKSGHQNLKKSPRNLPHRSARMRSLLPWPCRMVWFCWWIAWSASPSTLVFAWKKKCSKFGKTNDQTGQMLTRFC